MPKAKEYKCPIEGYDEETYLKANADIADGVEKGLIQSGMEHLVIFGLAEIERGDRPFHKDMPRYDEKSYLLLFPYVRESVRVGRYRTPFDHFCKTGYKKMLSIYRGDNIPIEGYDIFTYIEANPDVKSSLERGELESALEHLNDEGMDEIKRGIRRYHKSLPPFDPVKYLEDFPDAAKEIEKGLYRDEFDHFCKGGYKSVLQKYEDIISMPIAGYDEETYLAANPDIARGVAEGLIRSGMEHLIIFGLDEIKRGSRRFHKDYAPFDEHAYLSVNPDIAKAVAEGKMSSGWDHFATTGYKEMIEGVRSAVGYCPFDWNEDIKERYRERFDEESYLEANSDVKYMIEEEEIESGWAHFSTYGIEDVRRGLRTLHPNIPPVSEERYVALNPDIAEISAADPSFSPFEHFLFHGTDEILTGARNMPGAVRTVYIEPDYNEEIEKEMEEFDYKPLFSIVMPVYNTDVEFLSDAVESIRKQWYERWELCICDDASTDRDTLEYLASLKDDRIKIKYRLENGNISRASNDALELATGDFAVLMDHDDEISPDALYMVTKAINEHNPDFVYSDEDKIEPDGRHSEAHFKPDYSPDMFLSQNYISHLAVIRMKLLREIGGWHTGVEGSQDYDLYLRLFEKSENIYHIPKILYHWRKSEGSTAGSFSDKSYAQDAGKEALKRAMKRRGIDAEVLDGRYEGTYRVKYAVKGNPLVSIVIPFRDKPELLDMCIGSILEKSTYSNFEIIGVSNNSEKDETYKAMERYATLDKRIKFYRHDIPFNYSEINNYAVKELCNGEHLILLNNDIEIITEDWIESLLEFSQREDVGAVGAKLYYPDNRLQHAGVIVGLGGVAGHSHKYFPADDRGYFFRPHIVQNLSAVTAACMMIKRDLYLEAGGMDEVNLEVAFNDVDLCLRLMERGYLNVYTPYCEAYHHESLSRGSEDDPEKAKRFRREIEYMKKRHARFLEKGDPYYNPHLTHDREDFSLGRI